jgi:EAL domain-containing protein (putative c-di-GMP-specific phosphodiesterase class I)
VKRTSARRVVESVARTDLRAGRSSRPTRRLVLQPADLVKAVERSELILHYQPIVDLRAGQCRRVEALLRWRHPRFGLLLPADFIGIAATSGLLEPIGRWVIDAAKRRWQEWRDAGEPLGVSVNMSGAELAAFATIHEILTVLRPLEADALTLELPPAAFTEHPTVRVAAQRFAAAGARISLDDVVAADAPGRSLASQLDEIKISRRLVARVATEPDARIDFQALVELARDFRLGIVAVGVEDRATQEMVASLGCDLAQGYWVSRPLVPDRLGPWRRWAVGVAFGGAVALAAHVGGGKAAGASAAGGGASAPAQAPGFLPSFCCLDLPTLGPSAPSLSALDTLAQRSGVTFAAQTTTRAEIFAECAVSQDVLDRLVNAVDRDIAELETEYGRSFQRRPAIYAFATRTTFAMGLQNLFGVRGPDAGLLAAANGGITLPRQGAIVLNLQNVAKDGDLSIVRHELTHALVHEIVGPEASLPAWFDEGLATLEERAAANDEVASARGSAIALSLLVEGSASLADLATPAEWAQRNATLDGRAYTVAAEAARLVEQRIGHDGVLRVLEATRGGRTFGAAYATEAGESLGDFERAFPARLAADQAQARIVQTPGEDGVRWALAGFTPGAPVTVTIEGTGYRLEYAVNVDRYGTYQAVFGSTAPHGEYTIRASGPQLTAVATIRT